MFQFQIGFCGISLAGPDCKISIIQHHPTRVINIQISGRQVINLPGQRGQWQLTHSFQVTANLYALAVRVPVGIARIQAAYQLSIHNRSFIQLRLLDLA